MPQKNEELPNNGEPTYTWVPDPLQMHAAVEASRTDKLPCMVCHRPTYNRGVYVPADPEAVGLGKPQEGKMRFFVYAICRRCNRIPNVAGLVQYEIEAGGEPAPEDVVDGREAYRRMKENPDAGI